MGAREAELRWVKEPSLSSALAALRRDRDHSQLPQRPGLPLVTLSASDRGGACLARGWSGATGLQLLVQSVSHHLFAPLLLFPSPSSPLVPSPKEANAALSLALPLSPMGDKLLQLWAALCSSVKWT